MSMSSAIFTAKLNKVHIGSKKLGLVRDIVVNKSAVEAERILNFSITKGSDLIIKPLQSAIASAKEKGVKKEDLIVKELRIDIGGYRKAVRFASRGRVHQLHKPLSNISIKLAKEDNGTAS